MDENVKILLNSTRNIDSVNVDEFNKIDLSNKRGLITEYDIRNVLSATEVFDIEREANSVYRIYGKIEYLSLLNLLKTNYLRFQDFFLPQASGNSKNLLNSFDFYLVKASTGYTHITSTPSTIEYIRFFEIIATPNDFEIYPIGFANNVYGEQAYAFNFNMDFDVSSYVDKFGFPATELFLYAQYKPAVSPIETLSATTWSNTGVANKTTITPIVLNIGDKVKALFNIKTGDIIEYAKSEFLQEQLTPQTFYIKTPYLDGVTPKRLIWKYNPFIPLRLSYFSGELSRANISGTSYEQTSTIPYYATEYPVGTGNYVWRNILPQGFFDPLTGIGVDYPFVNKKRYLFSNIIFEVVPDLTDASTLDAFSHILYGTPEIINTQPLDDLNNIGKPCQ